jgi:DNA repair ATPase RecN
METHQTKKSKELVEEIITVTAGQKPFRYLQESHSDNIIYNTNRINQQFHDELEKWNRKNGPLEDINKQFNDELEKWRCKNGPTTDVNKEFHDKLEKWRRKYGPIKDVNKVFKDLKEKSQIYEESDTMRSMLRELRKNNSRLISQVEYLEERINSLSANTRIYKSQITAQEEENMNYKLIILKNEQTIIHLKNEVLMAQDKIYKTAKSLEISKENKEETQDVTKTNIC